MEWYIDERTQAAARFFPLRIHSQQPVKQYCGRTFVCESWVKYLRPHDKFLIEHDRSAPDKIIEEFQAGHYLPGLALTVSWGNMSRRNKATYRCSLQLIHEKLQESADSIRQRKSIDHAWSLLTKDLGWSNVMASKTLHFLCRAMGFTQNPPVPIDGEVMIKRVWPSFQYQIPRESRPETWSGNCFDAYSRYMTAILTWADQQKWTTTQIECTIYDQFA